MHASNVLVVDRLVGIARPLNIRGFFHSLKFFQKKYFGIFSGYDVRPNLFFHIPHPLNNNCFEMNQWLNISALDKK